MKPIETLVSETRERIDTRIADGLNTPDGIADLHKTLDMTMSEYVKFQELKSIAVSDKTLALEDGLYIYRILGEAGPDAFNRSDIAVKGVLTELFTLLMTRRMGVPA